jgi:hypothetical protein
MRAPPYVVLAYVALFLATALYRVPPQGDYGEYILMSRAFVARGTPAVTRDDAAWLARREKTLRVYARGLRVGLERKAERTYGTVRAGSGRYYALHFWFYSLLAAPALALLELVRGPPVLALALVNVSVALAASWYAMRAFRGHWLELVAPGAFLLTGTSFYLAFTGPEVLTASGVFVAALAARRRELGVGFFAAGLASTQNPSAAAMFGFVALECFRLRAPAAADSPVMFNWRRTLPLAAGGLLIATLPYAFFLVEFGVPSLLGKYATDFSLIGFERAFSLFFDLNQGMAAGLPGLFGGLAVVLALGRGRLARWAPRLAATIGVVLVMAIPTLAPHNWNPGAVVILRYAYWLAMPLLALLLELAAELPLRSSAPALLLFSALQVPVLLLNGYRGGSSSYLRHSWLARTVLKHAPAAYNPIPEIFIERTLSKEVPAREEKPITFPRRGAAMKVLVHERGLSESSRECSRGEERVPSSVRWLPDDWQYQNGPFACVPRVRP